MFRLKRVATPCQDALRSSERSKRRSRMLTACALFAVLIAVSGPLRTNSSVLYADDGSATPLHRVIDSMISADWQAKGIQPAGPSSDAEFLRRIYLDLIGAVPTADEARAFLDDTSPEKREKLIDQLLEREEYARHMQRQFDVMLMERRGDKNIPRAEWQEFLHSSFAANKPWDQIAREILAADGTEEKIRPAAKFYLDRDGETNLLTRDVGRLFLGIDLECAQCHDHPTVLDYLQEDYYGIFAYLNRSYVFNDKENKKVFFAEKAEGDVTFKSVFDPNTTNETLPRLPGFEQIEEPSYEKGQEYEVAPDKDNKVRPVPRFSRRQKLAEDLPRGENPLFAKNIVNRLWAMTVGRGLVHPVDMHHAENPPSHPELLELLADRFVAMGFDVKQMLRELARSRVYQLSSEWPEGVAELPEDRFAVARLKPLSPEQLAWSIMRVSGLPEAERKAMGEKLDKAALRQKLDKSVSPFVQTFAGLAGQPEGDFQATMNQALFVSNGGLLRGWLAPRDGNLTDRLTKLSGSEVVCEELYLSVFSRLPTDEERSELVELLNVDAADRPARLQQIAWALLATTEFRFNH